MPVDELRTIAVHKPNATAVLLASEYNTFVQARAALAADDSVYTAATTGRSTPFLRDLATVAPEWVQPLEADLQALRDRSDTEEIRNAVTETLDAVPAKSLSTTTGPQPNNDEDSQPQPVPAEIPAADPLAVNDPTFDVIESHSGGFDRVSIATVTEIDRVVAVKHPDGTRLDGFGEAKVETSSGTVFQRFRDEIENWGKVDSSPYIVSVLGSGMRPFPHIILEYADGGTLRQRMATEDIGVAEALWIGECLATAKRHAEKRGVMHHDIKPENVLFRTAEGDTWPVPKVSDWGLSKQLWKHPPSEIEGLSPPYVAPEQWTAEASVDHEADVFQLGVVLYELLTGRQPGDGTDDPAEWYDDVRPVELGRAVPDDVSVLLDEMLSPEPTARVTVNDVANRLRSSRQTLDTDGE